MPFGTSIRESTRALSLASLGAVVISLSVPAQSQPTAHSQDADAKDLRIARVFLAPADTGKAPPQDRDLYDERLTPGEVLSAGNNSIPTGALRVITYRLEKVQLVKPLERFDADGTKRKLEIAFRLKITLDSPPNNDYFIWIDDVPWRAYPSGYEKLSGENAISLVLLTSSVPFPDGSTLAISTYSKKFERTMLPEKLVVPLEVLAKPLPQDARTYIKSIRSGLIVAGKIQRRVVWITINSPNAFPVMNSAPALEIWDKVIQGGGQGSEASFMIGADELEQLKDGTQVLLNGPGPISGWAVGRLNKSMLDR